MRIIENWLCLRSTLKACLIDFSLIASSNWSSIITHELRSSEPKNPGVGRSSEIKIMAISQKYHIKKFLIMVAEYSPLNL